MSRRFLYPCDHCHQAIPIETTQAGNTIACSHCQAKLVLPTLKVIRGLPEADGPREAAPRRVSLVRASVFTGGLLLVLLSLGTAAVMGYQRSLLNTSFSTQDDIKLGNQTIDGMNYDQMWMAWQTLVAEGIGPKMPLGYLEERKTANMLNQILIASAIAGVLGLGAMIGSTIGTRSSRAPKSKILTLTKEFERILVDHFANQAFGVAAAAHFQDQVGNGGRLGRPPVAGRVRPSGAPDRTSR